MRLQAFGCCHIQRNQLYRVCQGGSLSCLGRTDCRWSAHARNLPIPLSSLAGAEGLEKGATDEESKFILGPLCAGILGFSGGLFVGGRPSGTCTEPAGHGDQRGCKRDARAYEQGFARKRLLL